MCYVLCEEISDETMNFISVARIFFNRALFVKLCREP